MKSYPIRFGVRNADWHPLEARQFLEKLGKVCDIDETSFVVVVAGFSLTLRVVNERWMWAYGSKSYHAYHKNGKVVMRKWQNAIRREVETADFPITPAKKSKV